MIHYTTGWNSEKNLGQYWNHCMDLIDRDDWWCFRDGDTMWTTDYWGKQIEDVVKKHPECRSFTCVTNRVGCPWQMVGKIKGDDYREHREFGHILYTKHYSEVKDVTNNRDFPFSGVLLLVQKSLWIKLGGFKKKGVLGVDYDWHWKVMNHDELFYMMTGLYLYHWYRGGKSHKNSHLL